MSFSQLLLNPIVLALIMLMGILVYRLSRQFAMVPVLITALYLTMNLKIIVGGFDFTILRIILLIVLFIFNLVGTILKQFIKLIMLGWVDSLGGALLGLFVGSLLAAAVFIAVGKWASTVGAVGVQDAIGESALAELLMDSFRLLLLLLPERFQVVKDFFN